MRGDTPFTGTKRFRLRFFDCFRNFLGNQGFFRFRLSNFAAYDSFSFEAFTYRNRINVIKAVLLFLSIELAIPYQPVQCVGCIRPGNLTGFIVYHDRKGFKVAAEYFTQTLRNLFGCMPLPYIPFNGMLALDIAVPFPERSLDIHLRDDPVRGNISARLGIHNRRVMHPGLRKRHLAAGKVPLHFIKALLFLRSQVRSFLHHVTDMPFNHMPAQGHFLIGFPSAELHSAGVVVNEPTASVQEGMAVPADPVFIAQENPRVHGGRVLRVQGGNPHFAAFKA